MIKRMIVTGSLMVLVAVLVVGCSKKTKNEEKQPAVNTITAESSTLAEETATDVTEADTHEGEAKSLLTGKWINEDTAKKRPLAVMLGNTQSALPQYGIGQADVLYECPVEGGLTRLMAIFQDYSKLDKLGSVRSCRLYYAYFAMEFDAIYCHYGQASYALDFLNSGKISDLNGLDGKIDSLVFYRDSSRQAPHNAFTTTDGIKAGIAYKGFDTEYEDGYEGHYQFAEDDDFIQLDGDPAAVMCPGYSVNHPWFQYNKKKKKYYRFQYNEKHVDGANNKQLSFTNVIFQNADETVLDAKGYLEFETTGSGTGEYFTGGKMINITWKKKDIYSPAVYYDGNGNELTINQGKTCVCVIANQSLNQVSVYKTKAEFQASR